MSSKPCPSLRENLQRNVWKIENEISKFLVPLHSLWKRNDGVVSTFCFQSHFRSEGRRLAVVRGLVGPSIIVLFLWTRNLLHFLSLHSKCINSCRRHTPGEPCDGLASHPGGSKNTPSCVMLSKLGLSFGRVGHLVSSVSLLFLPYSSKISQINDCAFFCYCAYRLRISRYLGFLWVVLLIQGYFARFKTRRRKQNLASALSIQKENWG